MAEKNHYHFIGVCGTAMGAVAAAMKERGITVTGSDERIYPPMSTFLEDSGVEIVEGYRASNIPESADVIIIGNTISRGNEEAEEALNRKLLYQSLPEVLKDQFLRGKRNFVVTGTHGKTTTSAILTWVLQSAGLEPGYMIGGIPGNLGRGACFTDSEFNVLEGDEYDTAFFDKRSKFLHYLPEFVIVNNIEFDHADIYDSLDEIKLTFRRLLNIVPGGGMTVVNGDDCNVLDVIEGAPCPVRTLGFGKRCDMRIEEVSYETDGSSFTLVDERYTIPMVGEFNVRNAAMAVAGGMFAGLSPDEVRSAFSSFRGIARRQQLRGEVRGVRVIDDFAHHPTAIRLAVLALRQRYPDARLWVVFEPRSNTTRRNIFQAELADALASADRAVVPAIEDPEKFAEEERLDPEQLVRDIDVGGGRGVYLPTVEEIAEYVVAEVEAGDVVAILSNGGFGGLHGILLERLGEAATGR